MLLWAVQFFGDSSCPNPIFKGFQHLGTRARVSTHRLHACWPIITTSCNCCRILITEILLPAIAAVSHVSLEKCSFQGIQPRPYSWTGLLQSGSRVVGRTYGQIVKRRGACNKLTGNSNYEPMQLGKFEKMSKTLHKQGFPACNPS